MAGAEGQSQGAHSAGGLCSHAQSRGGSWVHSPVPASRLSHHGAFRPPKETLGRRVTPFPAPSPLKHDLLSFSVDLPALGPPGRRSPWGGPSARGPAPRPGVGASPRPCLAPHGFPTGRRAACGVAPAGVRNGPPRTVSHTFPSGRIEAGVRPPAAPSVRPLQDPPPAASRLSGLLSFQALGPGVHRNQEPLPTAGTGQRGDTRDREVSSRERKRRDILAEPHASAGRGVCPAGGLGALGPRLPLRLPAAAAAPQAGRDGLTWSPRLRAQLPSCGRGCWLRPLPAAPAGTSSPQPPPRPRAALKVKRIRQLVD